MDDNQITAFHPGAMSHSHLNEVPSDGSVRLGIVAPDGREGMLAHAAQFAEHGIPFIFDPGQGLPMFGAQELDTFLDLATYAVFNDYEAQLVVEKTGSSIAALARKVSALIVTRGGQGSDIHVDGRLLHIPTAKTQRVVDPTGCGDAYRAGLLYGLANGMDWETTGRLAAVMGALKIEHSGAQNHSARRDEIADRFRESFEFGPW
jgi:adenosine kinase